MEPAFHQQLTGMMYVFTHILFVILFICLAVITGYLLYFSLVGHIKKNRPRAYSENKKRIAVLITSYREDNVIVNTVRSAVEHDYPAGKFRVFVAADQLMPSTVEQLRALNANIYEMNFASGSKARSLNFLLNNIRESDYDIALVVDGDNIMQPGFLEQVNAAFDEKNIAVQAHRTAKNLDSPIAVLDALSEEVNNHLFRRAQNNLHLSASLIGSGMAFPFSELKRIYNKPGILDNPACDREVDFEMLRSGLSIRFLDKAYILDEKVAFKQVYENQRRRWLESQLVHLRMFFARDNRSIPKTGDFWNKLFINLIPPRLMIIAVFTAVFLSYLLQFFLNITFTSLPLLSWIVLFNLYLFALFISIPRRLINAKLLRAVIYLPILAFSLLKASFTLRPGRKEFVHTPKNYTGHSETTNP